MKRPQGYTLIEILTAMVIVGLLAMFSVPAILSTTTKHANNSVGKTETMVQSFVTMVQNFEASTANQYDPTGMSIAFLFSRYGTYLSLQMENGVNYFLLADGARLTNNPNLFINNTLGYNTTSNVTWNGTDGNACGDFNPAECFYYDFNGAKPPNRIGKTGDIIPLHYEPTTDGVKTLYAAMLDLNPANVPVTPANSLCNYVSAYDVYTNTPGANVCTFAGP